MPHPQKLRTIRPARLKIRGLWIGKGRFSATQSETDNQLRCGRACSPGKPRLKEISLVKRYILCTAERAESPLLAVQHGKMTHMGTHPNTV